MCKCLLKLGFGEFREGSHNKGQSHYPRICDVCLIYLESLAKLGFGDNDIEGG